MSDYNPEVEYVSVPRDLLDDILDGYSKSLDMVDYYQGYLDIETMRNLLDPVEEEFN